MKAMLKMLKPLMPVLMSLFFVPLLSPAQVNVVKITDSAMGKDVRGFRYFLPRTRLVVKVEVRKTEKFKGPYAAFAEKFLGLSHVIQENATEYTLGNVALFTMAEPDPGQCYLAVKTRKFLGLGRAISADLTTNSLLEGFNTGKHASLYRGKDQPGALPDRAFQGHAESTGSYFSDLFKYSAETNFIERVDTVFETVDQDSVFSAKPVYQTVILEKPVEQKAREAADYISRVRESRLNLISGTDEVPYEKGTMEVMNERLEKLEKDYLSLFTGLTTAETISYVFTYLPPEQPDGEPVTLFNFSREKGVSDGGNPVMLRLRQKGRPLGPTNAEEGKQKKKAQGFCYRIPGQAAVSLEYLKSKLAEKDLNISQFGRINCLPAGCRRATFDVETGALRSIITKY